MSELRAPATSLLDRYEGTQILPLYTAEVKVSGGSAGHARASGTAKSSDGALDVGLRLPKELGGPGGGTNPEQLFAAGYAACFHGALSLIASKRKVRLTEVSIVAKVTFGRDPSDGLFMITADLEVELPGVDKDLATSLIEETEAVCPYAKMSKRGFAGSISLKAA
ncbi:Ohr family peroxiredoxin [Bradyrhizobium tropiciagri]|uniref:Ohr family peroxiredoxin n=1 Tax=Bradyrhizobium tropiciagri TaxID=312253 RepID=UPI00067CBA03|nr:Ohr family peroxiredoxin [Bradyrhizobium tropiciagri]